MYIYSGQKLNVTEQQKAALRAKLAQDKHHQYSYNGDFFSLGSLGEA